MYHEARAQDKKLRAIMVDYKKRAERKRAYFDARAGDPKQMLRVLGTAAKVHGNADQYYQAEKLTTLVPWQGNKDVTIDRFDGRGLLWDLPEEHEPKPAIVETAHSGTSRDGDPPLADKLQFERFRDLIERSRLGSNMAGSSEKAHLDEALAWWDSVLDRAAILAAARAKVKEGERESSRNRAAIGYNYGTGTVVEATAPPPSTAEEREDSTEAEREDRLMRYINGLNDADAFAVDKAAAVLGVRDYCRQIIHLRRLKLDLAREQNKDKGRHRRRRRHRHRHRRDISQQQSGNRSPVYGRYGSGSSGSGSSDGSGSDDSGDEASGEVQYITEFDQQQSSSGRASTTTSKAYDEYESKQARVLTPPKAPSTASPTTSSAAPPAAAAEPAKKLTPMEKLKLKMRAGLNQTVEQSKDSDQRKQDERLQQVRKENEELRDRGVSLKELPPAPVYTYRDRRRSRSRSRSRSRERRRHRSRSRSPPSSRRPRSRSRSPRRYK